MSGIPTPNQTDLLTTGAVARMAGVSEKTVRAWQNAGDLPAMRIEGGMRLFHRKDVEAFLANREVDRAEKEMNR